MRICYNIHLLSQIFGMPFGKKDLQLIVFLCLKMPGQICQRASTVFRLGYCFVLDDSNLPLLFFLEYFTVALVGVTACVFSILGSYATSLDTFELHCLLEFQISHLLNSKAKLTTELLQDLSWVLTLPKFWCSITVASGSLNDWWLFLSTVRSL